MSLTYALFIAAAAAMLLAGAANNRSKRKPSKLMSVVHIVGVPLAIGLFIAAFVTYYTTGAYQNYEWNDDSKTGFITGFIVAAVIYTGKSRKDKKPLDDAVTDTQRVANDDRRSDTVGPQHFR